MATAYLNSAGVALSTGGATTRGFVAAANSYQAGSAGNDALRTGGGSTMAGGAGDDTYYVYTSSDKVIEKAGEGIDTIISYAQAYTLPSHVENLTLLASNSTGTGNALDNIIKGGSGPQTLNGGAGNDVLIAGTGPTTFVVAKGEGSDVIYGFKSATDLVQLNSYGSLTTFAKVKAAMSQVGSDTVIALGGGETLTLRDHKVSDFTAANFQLPKDMSGTNLVFSDEFNSFSGSATGKGTTWMTALPYSGLSARNLASNKEVQYYSDTSVGVNPFSIHDGVLDITAAHATPGIQTPAGSGLSWTSGLITTFNSFSQLYGYFEVKAQLPSGAGFWPAFWLLPADNTWPPELDIFEVLSKDTSTLYASTHSKVGGPNVTVTKAIHTADLSASFHTYGVDWKADKITWYLDGNAIAQADTPSDMHKPMYMLLNLAVGGNGSWPGPTDATTPSEGHMLIDYVRAYTVKPASTTQPGDTGGGQISSLSLASLVAGAAGGASATLAGAASAGAQIGIYDGTTLVGSATADAATGAFTVALSGLGAGTHLLSATVDGAAAGTGLTVAVGSSAEIVGQLKTLQATPNLGGIYLTDTHVLTVDSVSAMQTLIATNTTALAAIQGGYSFAVATTAGATRTIASYDASGTWIDTALSTLSGGQVTAKTVTKADGSSTAYVYAGGAVVSETQTHTDKTKDVYLSGIAGKSYVAEHSTYDARGTLLSTVRSHADGTADYKYTFNAETRDKITEVYSASGDITMRTTVNVKNDTLQQKYTDTILSSEYTYYAPNSSDIAALKTYTNGILTRENVRHADQSSDTYIYNVTGKSNVAEHDAFDSAGKIKFVDLTLKDGSHLITASQTQQILVSTTGASDTFKGMGGDTFVFHKGFGADVIQGFHAGGGTSHDILQIDKALAADKAHLTITSVGQDTLIHVGEVDSILLKGVAASSLSHDNFLFA
jgi:beta-glucanase (GH16 family)